MKYLLLGAVFSILTVSIMAMNMPSKGTYVKAVKVIMNVK